MRSGFCLLLAALLLVGGCVQASGKAAADLPAPRIVSAADGEVTVAVMELFCHSCAEKIQQGCREILGVSAVQLDRREHTVTLRFDRGVTTTERVLAAVDEVVAAIR